MFRRRLISGFFEYQTDIEFKEIQFNQNRISFTLQDLYQNLTNEKYKIEIYLIGSGGNAGKKGQDSVIYWGGSGGAGANGNIVIATGVVPKNKILTFETTSFDINARPRSFSFIYNDKLLITANAGGNGANGGNATTSNKGNGGKGGTSQQPIINNANLDVFKIKNTYYDAAAKSGNTGGGGADIIYPNMLEDMEYAAYASGGIASPDNLDIIGGRGAVIIKLYYDEFVIEKLEKYIEVPITAKSNKFSVASVYPHLKDDLYQVELWIVASGGKAGYGGNNWLWYKGGSGGSGSNGNIVHIKGQLQYNKELIVECTNPDISLRPRQFTIKDGTVTYIIAYSGGDGTKGSDADWTGDGLTGGKGGIGKPPYINLPPGNFKLIDSYYDEKGNDGRGGGAGSDIISPNPINANIKYKEYAIGGSSTYNNQNLNGQSGIVMMKIYYNTNQEI